jgi:hypothetical protein
MTVPATFFSTDLFWSCVQWLMITVIWAVFAFGTWREDRKIRRELHDTPGELDTHTLLSMLHKRDMQIWLQLSLLLVIVAIADIRHNAELLPPDFFAPQAVEAPPAVEVVTPAKPKESPDEHYDRILRKNTVSGLPFSDITAFNEQNGKREAYIDWLKERYESWLITYYYLQKCRAVTTADFDVIHKAMERDLQAAHANETVLGNILMAANGSFEEMYSSIPCDAAHISTTKSGYDVNMQQIRTSQLQQPSPAAPAAPAKPGTTR